MALWKPGEIWAYATLLINAVEAEQAAGRDGRGPLVQALDAIDQATSKTIDQKIKTRLEELITDGEVHIGPPYPTP